MLRPGDRLDRYVIDRLLGEGGMGAVYRARDEKLHRTVALRVLSVDGGKGSSAQQAELAARMPREARAAAALDHPNVVSVFDVGEHEGAPYIAMELVVGKTLERCSSSRMRRR
jgi:eukaryotic-like serine/threonine-protein kinase